jgi:hypothetical protein
VWRWNSRCWRRFSAPATCRRAAALLLACVVGAVHVAQRRRR